MLQNSENSQEKINIPWLNNQNEFEKRIIEVKYKKSKKAIYVWQHGEKIRYSESGYEDPSSAILGSKPNAGGDRMLEINKAYVALN